MNDVLAEITTAKAAHVADSKARHPLAEIEKLAASAAPPRGFADALRRMAASGLPSHWTSPSRARLAA